MSRRCLLFFAALCVFIPGASAASVNGLTVLSYTGDLSNANIASCGTGCTLGTSGDFAQYAAASYTFTVPVTSGVKVTTFSYGGGTNGNGALIAPGGFEPYLSLFDSAGNLLTSSYSGITCPTGSNSNAALGACYDVQLSAGILAAGTYQIVISAFDNLSFAENFGAGLLSDGFTGLGNLNTGEDLHYAFDITVDAAPFVGYVAFWGANNSGVTISWSTDKPANTFVAYGTTPALGQTSPLQTALTNSHGVLLNGLNAGTTYYFRAESTDAYGTTGQSALYTFTTTGQPGSPSPVISNVNVTNITTTSATISWTTDQASTSEIYYGLTPSYGSSFPPDSTLLVTSHSVTLNGLVPGTTYNFEVASGNSSGTGVAMSSNSTFSTVAVISAPPAITNIQTSVTTTGATITWTTDQASNSAVNYGSNSTTPDSNYVTSHSVTLTNLTPGTVYNFSVVSTNTAGLSTTSPNSTFTTTPANAAAPYVGYVAAWGINGSNATVTWSTDVPADTQLNYGTTPSLGTLSPLQSTPIVSHGVTLTGLASGTTYYFVAQSKGANGATGYSTTYSFTTTGSPSAPAPIISNIQTTVTNTSATVTWTTDQAASSQVSYGVTTTYSASSTLDPTLTTTHSATLTNLMPGTTYNFEVMSANVNGLSATSPNSTFKTTGSAPGPIVTGVAASSVTSGTALITWTTDQASTSVVNYGNSQTASAPALVTSHSIMLSGLTPNTLYSFTVTSANAAGVSTTSTAYNFTTVTPSAATPVISYLAFWGVTSSGVTISWSTDVPSNTSVAYGTTSALGTNTPVQTALSNSHGVTLTGLQPGTTYYFKGQSADVNGNTGVSTIYTFTTLGGGLPTISGLVITPTSSNTATVSWTTSVPAYSYVQYGTSAGNYNRYSVQTSLTSSPTCTLSYVPSGTIHYQLVSTDAYGNQVVSPDATFVEP